MFHDHPPRLVRQRCVNILLILVVLAAFGAKQAQALLIPISGIDSVAVGRSSVCALDGAGTVLCWGMNTDGRLNNGDTGESRLPRPVAGLPGPMASVVAGETHHCALDSNAQVWCWGLNDQGQLGNGTFVDSFSPVQVSGLAATTVAISAGNHHTCAISAAGVLACWGDNLFGQLGDGSTADRAMPTVVAGLPAQVRQVAAGSQHTCAVTTDDAAFCWGSNADGALGDGSTVSRTQPTAVSGMSADIQSVDAGQGHSCALLGSQQTWCWGSNIVGQLGDASTVRRTLPVQVSGLTDAVQLTLGEGFSCARQATGSASCWGQNYSGNLGNGTFANRLIPDPVLGISDLIAVAAGGYTTCGLRAGGQLLCWGSNSNGELGDGSLPHATQPSPVAGAGASPRQLALGSRHSCIRSNSGSVRCWGDNSARQLGDNTEMQRLQPVNVAAPWNAAFDIAAANSSNCAIVNNDVSRVNNRVATPAASLGCWGANETGQLGIGNNASTANPMLVVSAGPTVSAVDLGALHSCIAAGSGETLSCSGSNASLQSCRADVSASNVFVGCDASPANVLQVAAGPSHTCALDDLGAVNCWGSNALGQLGDGTGISTALPVTPLGLGSGMVQVVAGRDSACALSAAGAVQCWGGSSAGQLGDGTTTNRLSPVAVLGLQAGVVALASGSLFVCARASSGSARCWGSNHAGQMGDGTVGNSRLTAVPVSGLSSGVLHIAAGDSHACALGNGGLLSCWGKNERGQLGDGTAEYRARASAVLIESVAPPFEHFADGFEAAP